MFIWDFVADKILGQIVDWFYGQVVGFLGNFFAEMGNMGVELFEMSWVQSIVLFFSYLAWALYGTGLVVACFECGIEYSSGRGNIRETALNAIKGFMAVSLFTVVPVRLYELSVTLQGQLTAGITGYGASIGDVASDIMQEFSAVETLTDLASGPFLGFGSITSGFMILFCIYANYDMEQDHLCDTLELNLCKGDGSEERWSYPLNAAEQEVLLNKVEAFCQQQTGMSLHEYARQLRGSETQAPEMQM